MNTLTRFIRSETQVERITVHDISEQMEKVRQTTLIKRGQSVGQEGPADRRPRLCGVRQDEAYQARTLVHLHALLPQDTVCTNSFQPYHTQCPLFRTNTSYAPFKNYSATEFEDYLYERNFLKISAKCPTAR